MALSRHFHGMYTTSRDGDRRRKGRESEEEHYLQILVAQEGGQPYDEQRAVGRAIGTTFLPPEQEPYVWWLGVHHEPETDVGRPAASPARTRRRPAPLSGR